MPNDTKLESGLVSCTECGSEAICDASVCTQCGGFLAGSPKASLGVFSARTYLDDVDESPVPDAEPETVLVVEREVRLDARVAVEAVPEDEVEIPLAVGESKWPMVSQFLLGLFYLLFVIAVAVAVNKILRAL